MIVSNFEVINHIFDDDTVIFEMEYPTITITFSGNTIKNIKLDYYSIIEEDITVDDIYGKVLLSHMDGLKRFFIVLRNKTIFCLDEYTITDINNIIESYETIKNLDSFKLIHSFSSL